MSALSRRLFFCAWAVLSILAVGAAAKAAGLPQPSGPVLLTVSGAIAESNGSLEGIPSARFDRAMLERLPQSEIVTQTPWTDGEQRFEGVRLVELLRLLRASGREVTLGALNDYRVSLNLRQYAPFEPLLAMRHNGAPMRIADKGPIWLVFPQDDFPELDQAGVHDLWVWQLNEIVVE